MSLSVVERREFLAFAALVERADTPELRLALASGLRLWVDARTAPRGRAADEQLELLDANDDASTTVADANDDRHGRAARELSTSKGAIYQRARRARKKAEAAVATPATTPATVVDDRRGTSVALSEREILSPSNSKGEISRVRARADLGDPHDRDRPEPEDLEVALERRPDLPESIIRHSWFRFAKAHPYGTAEHWRNWVGREDVSKTGLAPAPCTPPKSESRPIVRARDVELPPCDITDAIAAVERATGPPVRAPAVA